MEIKKDMRGRILLDRIFEKGFTVTGYLSAADSTYYFTVGCGCLSFDIKFRLENMLTRKYFNITIHKINDRICNLNVKVASYEEAFLLFNKLIEKEEERMEGIVKHLFDKAMKHLQDEDDKVGGNYYISEENGSYFLRNTRGHWKSSTAELIFGDARLTKQEARNYIKELCDNLNGKPKKPLI